MLMVLELVQLYVVLDKNKMKDKLLKEISNRALEFKSLYAKYHDIYVTAESLTAGLIGASIVEFQEVQLGLTEVLLLTQMKLRWNF